jgi:hypothetical protein
MIHIPADVLDRATKAVAQCFARMAGDATIKRHLDVMYGEEPCGSFATSIEVPDLLHTPTDKERLDWLANHSPCPDWKPLTSLHRGQIDALMRRRSDR